MKADYIDSMIYKKCKGIKYFFNIYAFEIGVVCFVLLFVMNILYQIFFLDNILDSDMASELILGKMLSKKDKIFSGNWYYSTEIRVVYITQIAMILFHFIHNFMTVRVLSSIILYIFLLLSSLYAFRALRLKKEHIIWAEVLLFLPSSRCVLEFVFAGGYYIPYMCLVFVMMGLFLNCCRKNSWHMLLYSVLLGEGAFLFGLIGIRGLTNFALPTFLATVVMVLWQRRDKEYLLSVSMFTDRRIWFAFLQLLACCAGWLVNQYVFTTRYLYFPKNEARDLFSLRSGSLIVQFGKVVQNLLGLFGAECYQERTEMLSVQGILTLFSVAALLTFVLIYRDLVRKFSETEHTIVYIIFWTFCSLAINCVSMVFSGMEIVEPHYFLLILQFSGVVFLYWFYSKKPSRRKYVIMSVVIFTLSCSTILTFYDCCTRGENKELKQVVEFAEKNELDLGIATFWNSNVMTELSDDKIRTWTVVEFQNLQVRKWLTKRSVYSEQYISQKRPFLLLTKDEALAYAAKLTEMECMLLYQNGKYRVYSYTPKVLEMIKQTNEDLFPMEDSVLPLEPIQ